MTDLLSRKPETAIDVAIIGGGPAGLAAGTALKQAGVANVVVLEREAEAGGIPRHCGHPPFGMREFGRVLKGPAYAQRLVSAARAAGVEIRTLTTVAEIRPDGRLLVVTSEGHGEITARRVIYATGVRETPRAARMISGDRCGGILNTGALQSMVYLKNARPFAKPVIIGSELVAFSAINTCKHAGIRPQAMIEANTRTTARWPSGLYPRLFGIPLLLGTKLEAIHGKSRVTGVQVCGPDSSPREIPCDGVILCGMFTPESSLGRLGHLEIDPATGGPVVDQYGRCSDPAFFATGNLLRPVETAGWSWREGRDCGLRVARDLNGTLPATKTQIRISVTDPRLKYVMPQKISLPVTTSGTAALQLRVCRPVRGDLVVSSGTHEIWRQKINTRPERRILVPLERISTANADLSIRIEPAEKS